MVPRWIVALLALLAAATGALAADNPAIDMQRYLRVSAEAARYRESHRLSEDEFIRMSQDSGTIIVDARSRESYETLHVTGAINLSFPDIAFASLQQTLPDKTARILIYCNNNFKNADWAFPVKAASASLNIATYIVLYDYGYRNVFELGPLLDIHAARLEFEAGPDPRGNR
jgi:rhodanese-related sulfurtransferase